MGGPVVHVQPGVCHGQVVSPPAVNTVIKEQTMNMELRKHRRCPVSLRSVLLWDEAHNYIVSELINVCEGGICFAAADAFSVGDMVNYKFTLPDKVEESLEGKGVLVWKDLSSETGGDIQYGMRFERIQQSNSKRIKEYRLKALMAQQH